MVAFAKRLKKVTYKGMWSLSGAVKSPPKIERLHRREVADDPEHFEFVERCAEPAYIEPKWGYVITGRGFLIEESMNPAWWPQKAWRTAIPSPLDFYRTAAKPRPQKVIRYPQAVSLRFLWEWNYYHFYLDVLGKLSLLADLEIDPALPLVLGRYALELPFVREIINTGKLKDRNWVIQDNTYVQADRLIYCRSQHSHRQRINYLLDLMEIPEPGGRFNDKIFLTRGPQFKRAITNMPEIEGILKEYGFRSVDTAGRPLAEQREIFARARYVIAIHGAGVTNIIFRRNAPLGLLELHPEGYISNDFKIICQSFGYYYDSLAGQPVSQPAKQADFSVSPGRLRARLDELLKTEYPDP